MRIFGKQIGSLVAVALLCSGCFEMEQKFEFSSDGTARIDVRMAVDAALMAMGNPDGASWCRDENLKKEGVTINQVLGTEGGDSVCTISISGKLEDVVGAAAQANAGGKQGLSLTRVDDGYKLAIEMPPFNEGTRPSDDSFESAMQGLLLAKMSGRALEWSVTAPRILATSGKISEDGRTATYSRPLAEAFTSSEPTRFDVTFSLNEPGMLGWFKSLFN
jgi:hypothetical protein